MPAPFVIEFGGGKYASPCNGMIVFYSILCTAQSGIKINIVNIPKRIAPGSYFNLVFDVESATTFKEPLTLSLKVPDTFQDVLVL